MKNIHLIPTEKPSRLFKDGEKLKLDIESYGVNNQHIYITSDEEIKERDWCFDIFLNAVFQANWFMGIKTKNTARKIILTTDSDLIADGVQTIDDEFLEWFVKNPSCESVDVKKRYSEFTVEPFVGYKIIIPQERHTIITDWLTENGDPEIDKKVEKQLELEEAAEKNYENKTAQIPVPTSHWVDSKRLQIQNFIEGAKSDAARDYWFEQFKK